MRSLSSGINSQLTVSGAYAGWLVQITPQSGSVLRYTSLDTNFSYGGFTWQSLDIDPPQLGWDGTALRAGKLVIGDADLVFWALALQLSLTDAAIAIYAIYAAAPTEAEPVFSGRIGQIVRNGLTVEMQISNQSDTRALPATRVQYVVNPAFLLPSGTVLNINGQRWILDRAVTAN